jgi:hypothetical protein
MSFEFRMAPNAGANWAKLYRLAADCLGDGDKLCYSAFQTDDRKGVCASTAVAIGICSVQQLRKLFPVVEDNGVTTVFDFNLEDDFGEPVVQAAIEAGIRSRFTEDQLAVMVHAVTALPGGDRADARYIADSLTTFLIEHNDAFFVGTGHDIAQDLIPATISAKYKNNTEFRENLRPTSDLERIDMEIARSKFVKQALLQAAEQAAAT